MTADQHSPTWYDLLGVSPDASTEEIRTAWRSGIADLEPGDRRFETRNRAASVLLDPQQRAAYDASLGGQHTADVPGTPSAPPTHQGISKQQARERRQQERRDRAATRPTRSTPVVPTWMLMALALLTVVMVAGTLIVWQTDDGEEAVPAEDVRDAQTAAERAVVPVVSYSFDTLEEDRTEAEGYLTPGYREDYDKLFSVIEDNAPETKTTVQADVIASGIVRSGEDRVDVLVFVDRPTTNRLNPEPVTYRDQVTLSMTRAGDQWLVADMKTSPTPG